MSQSSPTMSRSLKVRPDCIQRIQLALKHQGFASQQALACDRGISLSTVSKFLRGKRVDSSICIELCHVLGFEVKEVTELGHENLEPSLEEGFQPENLSISPNPGFHPPVWSRDVEAIDISDFYGRYVELETLKQWATQDHCRLIGITGIEGIGKTALTVKLVKQLQGSFEAVIWRSLSNLSTLESLLADLISSLTQQSVLDLPQTSESLLAIFLQTIRNHRCLVVFDQFESLFQENTYASCYKEAYKGYEKLLRAIAESDHQSCIITASREQPKEVAWFEGQSTPVKTLKLSGLSPSEGKEIFNRKGCYGSDDQHWQEIFDRYTGHPFALRVAAAAIQEMFGGNILGLIVFLRKDKLVFKDITEFWDRYFQRLHPIEQIVAGCIANFDSLSLDQLTVDLQAEYSTQELFEAVRSLLRRGLIERKDQTLQLHPYFANYVAKNRSAETVKQNPELIPV